MVVGVGWGGGEVHVGTYTGIASLMMAVHGGVLSFGLSCNICIYVLRKPTRCVSLCFEHSGMVLTLDTAFFEILPCKTALSRAFVQPAALIRP